MVLCIYGSGGAGKECLELAKRINEKEDKWNSILFVNDIEYNCNICGCDVYNFEYIKENFSISECEFIIAVGEPDLRERLHTKVAQSNYRFVRLMEEKTVDYVNNISNTDVIIAEGSFLTCGVTVEQGCYINTGCIICHDVKIEGFSVISPGVKIGGYVTIGKKTFVGIGAIISDRVHIGDNCIIGAGAVVIDDIPNDYVVVGNPAKFIRKNTDRKVFKNEN